MIGAPRQVAHADFLVDIGQQQHLHRINIANIKINQFDFHHIEKSAMQALHQSRQANIGIDRRGEVKLLNSLVIRSHKPILIKIHYPN